MPLLPRLLRVVLGQCQNPPSGMKLRNILMVMKDTCILTLDDFTYNMERCDLKVNHTIGSVQHPCSGNNVLPCVTGISNALCTGKHVIHNTWVSPRGRLRTLGVDRKS